MKLFKSMPLPYHPLYAALMAALAAPSAMAQLAVDGSGTDGQMQAVVVSASRSNIAADKAPQTVVIIGKAEIARQLAISGNSSDVLSSVL